MRRREGRGEVVKVSDLFAVYRERLHAPQGVVIDTFCEVITDLFSVHISKKQCSYTPTTKTLGVQVGGPLKSEIMLRKAEILAHMRGRLGDKSSPKQIV